MGNEPSYPSRRPTGESEKKKKKKKTPSPVSDYTSVPLSITKPKKPKRTTTTTTTRMIRILVRGDRKLFKRGDLLSDAIVRAECQLPESYSIQYHRWSQRDSTVLVRPPTVPESGSDVLKQIRSRDKLQCVYLRMPPERELDAKETSPIASDAPYTLYVGMGISVVLDRSMQTTHVGSCIVQYANVESEPYARRMLDILLNACKRLYGCSHMDIRYTARIRREFIFTPRYVNPVFVDDLCVVDAAIPEPSPPRLCVERLVFKVHRAMAVEVNDAAVREWKWPPSTHTNGSPPKELEDMAREYWNDSDFKSVRDGLPVLPRGFEMLVTASALNQPAMAAAVAEEKAKSEAAKSAMSETVQMQRADFIGVSRWQLPPPVPVPVPVVSILPSYL